MSTPYISFQQPFEPRRYIFSTNEGLPARVAIQTTFNLAPYDLIIEVDTNSEFRAHRVVATATFANGEIVLNLTPTDVSEIKDSFYRVRATGLNRSFLVVTGSINYNPIVTDNRILGPSGAVQSQFIGPITTALSDTFLKKEDYLPPDLSRVDDLEDDLAAATDSAGLNTLVRRNGGGYASFGGVFALGTPTEPNELTRKDYVDNLGTTTIQPNTIVRRDANGRGFFDHIFISHYPSAGNDAANKGYVDGEVNGAKDRANHTGTQSADTIIDGTDNKVFTADAKILLTQVTPDNMGWHTVRRDATGSFSATAVKELSIPVNPGDATNKGYVDSIGTDLATANTIMRRDAGGGTNVNWLYSNTNVSAAQQPTQPANLTRKDYVDGLGVSTPTANTIARRDANGFVQFARVDISNAPGGAAHATRKDYVDAGDAAAIVRSQYGNSMWSIGGAEPFTRPSNQVGLVSDFVTFSCFTAPVANTITKLSIPVETAGVGMTWFQIGLYTIGGDGRLTLVARTANNTTAAQTAGIQSLALDATGGFPISYTFVPGQRYAFGLRAMGSTNLVMQSWFLYTGGQYAPYIAQQLYLGTTTGLPNGTFSAGGTWWNAPYVVGLP